jgi:Zn-dependent metalloprotease
MSRTHRCLNCIVPPHLLQKLLTNKDKDVRHAALGTLLSTAQMRGERAMQAAFFHAPGRGRRTVYDCNNRTSLRRAEVARTENGEPSSDESVNRAFDGLGATRDFYKKVFNRSSIDDRGMRLDGYVHYGDAYNNAFWDGSKMVFGDGDGILFTDFTKSIDVIAHELAHGVTEFTAGLEYHTQSGALNESMSDVFGSLVKQWSLQQTADAADWLIGADIFTPGMDADALRSMKAPGSAYDNEDFGKDPQPDHMDKYVNLPDTPAGDNGGVHINSGIPNKAFYLAATKMGGFAWEAPGQIWYEALRASGGNTQFLEFAETTVLKAGQRYGVGGTEQRAVVEAWREVGITTTSPIKIVERVAPSEPIVAMMSNGQGYDALSGQIAKLAAQLATLDKRVSRIRNLQ